MLELATGNFFLPWAENYEPRSGEKAQEMDVEGEMTPLLLEKKI